LKISKKLYIFDRDGVLNQKASPPNRYILTKDDLIPILNTFEIIANIQVQGGLVCIATNQQGVGKGELTQIGLKQIHDEMNRFAKSVGVKRLKFFTCEHLEETGCYCRKPNPGLLKLAMSFYGIKESDTCFIGDSHSDFLAARAAGIDFLWYPHDLNVLCDSG
jgi:D-glycero-D-manno-heptose 1,7-bisphosphate phosphatase